MGPVPLRHGANNFSVDGCRFCGQARERVNAHIKALSEAVDHGLTNTQNHEAGSSICLQASRKVRYKRRMERPSCMENRTGRLGQATSGVCNGAWTRPHPLPRRQIGSANAQGMAIFLASTCAFRAHGGSLGGRPRIRWQPDEVCSRLYRGTRQDR